ncbi:MAG: metallophosphoesterase [Bryobacterales bacterium]|nr:metallophosphoesterase [Bryobacterales bacterium]
MRRLLTLALLAAHLSAATLWIGPYLQDVRTDRATVMWAALEPAAGQVAIAGAAANSQVTELTPARTGLDFPIYLHSAQLRNLTPDTDYPYSIRLNGEPVAIEPRPSFRTPGATAQTLLLIGDSGDGGEPQLTLAALLNQQPASALLHVGDIAYFEGTFRQFHDQFFEAYKPLLARAALFTTPGNHDYFEDAFPYRTLFSPPTDNVPAAGERRYYSFDWSNLHITVVDTNTPFEQAIEDRGPLLNWLDRDLRTTTQPLRIVLLHHSPFTTSGQKVDDPVSAMVRQYLTPIFERHAVHLVIGGHEHVYQRTFPRANAEFSASINGTIYVTSGAAGSQLYEPGAAPFQAKALGASHALRLLSSPQQLRVEAFSPDSTLLDLFTIPVSPQLTSVVNSASHQPDIAPGALITIYGWNLAPAESAPAFPLPTESRGTRATLGGLPLPIVYAGRTQINALVPFNAPLPDTPQILTLTTPFGTTRTTVRLSSAAPAIFTVPTTTNGPVAAAVHLNGDLVTDAAPAVPGEWLAVFGTGLGPVNGTLADGQPAPLSPLLTARNIVSASIAARIAEVSVACLAPGYSGLYQVNLRVPEGLPPGRQPLVWTTAGASSAPAALPIR